jgi:4-hydroxybenzoate polyprenyltransferase
MKPPLPIAGRTPYERVWAGNSRIKTIIALTHPTAVIIFSLVTWILAALTLSQFPSVLLSVFLTMAMAGVQASVGVFNEVFDWKLDKVSKQWRAIPAGMISPAMAALMASLLLCTGLLFAASISAVSMFVLLLGAGMGILYSAVFKRTVLSWLPYAVCYPSFPVWILVALGRFDGRILIIYLLASPFAIAVHLCNQLRDFDQDEAGGVKGLVQHLGKSVSVALCFGLVLLTPVPFLTQMSFLSQPVAFVALLLVGLLHWCLTLPTFLGRAGMLDAASFRSLFRRLQFTGPLMLLAWYGVFLSTMR